MIRPVSARRNRISSVILVFVLLILAGVFLKHDAIHDWWVLRNYTPTPAVAQLAGDDTMTDYAQHMFYVNHPDQQQKGTFAKYCPTGTEQTVVLGCYKGNQGGIYLLSVSNSELAGIEQVTAAHEMLHAAYDRMSKSDKSKVDALLIDYYHNHLTDESIKTTIESYKKSEPDALVNEMHSIFGTQIKDLPAGLQEYYSQYFADRGKVVGYYAAYDKAFTGRQQQVKAYDAQLANMKLSIDQLEETAKQQQADLQAQRSVLDRDRANGNGSGYNSLVDQFNASVRAYNANVTRLQRQISQYNQLVVTRNAITVEEQQLMQAISSSTTTK